MDNHMFKAVTVIVWYTDEGQYQEEYCPGFLTGEDFAMYVEPEYGEIVFVGVVPSRDPLVFIRRTVYLPLGRIPDLSEAEAVITDITTKLNQMTAYQFMINIIVPIRSDVDFGKLLIPGLLSKVKDFH